MRKYSPLKTVLTSVAALGALVSVASATTLWLNPEDFGSYHRAFEYESAWGTTTTVETGRHNPDSNSYIVGSRNANMSYYREYHNFFVFDVSDIDTAISATLKVYMVDGSFKSPTGSETWSLFDVTSDVADVTAGGSGLTAIYDDLGSGIGYGDVVITEADEGSFIEVTLNAAALAEINSNNGLFAIGGAITSEDGEPWNHEIAFGKSHDCPVVTLDVETAAIPEPSSMLLLGIGTIGFTLRRKRS